MPSDAQLAARAAEVDADLRSRGADYTPRGVAGACVEAVARSVLRVEMRSQGWAGLGGPLLTAAGLGVLGVSTISPLRVLDVCAGAGVWSSEFVRCWCYGLQLPRECLHLTAVEFDERDRPWLERVADEVIIGDWTEALGRSYHVAIGNPDFALLRAPQIVADSGRKMAGSYDVSASMPARLLECAPAVALFHTQQAWSKDGPGVAVRRVHPPWRAYDVAGSIRFRQRGAVSPKTGKPYGADQRCYTTSIWLRGHTGRTEADLLPDLPASARGWDVRPGTEESLPHPPPPERSR